MAIKEDIFFRLDNLTAEISELLLNAVVVDSYFMFNDEQEASEKNPYTGNHYMVAGAVFRSVYQKIEQVEKTIYDILDDIKVQERFENQRTDQQKALAKLTEKYGSKAANVIFENVHAQFINQHHKSADTFGQAWDGLDISILSDITYRAVHGLPCKEEEQ